MNATNTSGSVHNVGVRPPEGAISENFAAPKCLQCGACCFSTAEHYVPVTGADWSLLGQDAACWAEFAENRAFMRMLDGHCSALAIQPAHDPETGAEYYCSIYDKRPQVCRDLSRGSPQCHAEWTRKRATAWNAGEQS